MRIGAYQFSATENVETNINNIIEGIGLAAEKGVRLLLFQECALVGYPPLERATISDLNLKELELLKKPIYEIARSKSMYIVLGTIREVNSKKYNSLELLGPNGTIGYYDKRALWGWDKDNFYLGSNDGVFEVDGIRIGLRICFEVRFPEYFRELFNMNVDLCLLSFCDFGIEECEERYQLIKSHIITRAVENVFTIVTANSISGYKTAPTMVVDCNGNVEVEVTENNSRLLFYDYEKPQLNFGMEGRINISKSLQ